MYYFAYYYAFVSIVNFKSWSFSYKTNFVSTYNLLYLNKYHCNNWQSVSLICISFTYYVYIKLSCRHFSVGASDAVYHAQRWYTPSDARLSVPSTLKRSQLSLPYLVYYPPRIPETHGRNVKHIQWFSSVYVYYKVSQSKH